MHQGHLLHISIRFNFEHVNINYYPLYSSKKTPIKPLLPSIPCVSYSIFATQLQLPTLVINRHEEINSNTTNVIKICSIKVSFHIVTNRIELPSTRPTDTTRSDVSHMSLLELRFHFFQMLHAMTKKYCTWSN